MVEEPLRICLLSYRGNPRSGGQGIYVRLLSKELAEMGHQVDVWSGPPYPEIVDAPGVSLLEIPSLDLWNEEALFRTPTLHELKDPINRSEWIRTLLGGFVESRTFTQRVDRRFRSMNGNVPYDIVHDNQCLGIGLLEIQKRLPVIATIHHPITRDYTVAMKSLPWWNLYRRGGLRRWYTSFLPEQIEVARKLDRVLTISQASTDDIVEDFGIDATRVRMIGNGINLAVFEPHPGVERRENRLITTLSADVPLKGLAYLLDALAMLRRERPDLHLTVIGTPRKQMDTAERVKRLGLQDAVLFTGRVTADEIASRYAESTCAVVSSLYEGFGFPAGEAMACEVPLVSTRGGALPEVVGEGGETGVLVQPGSATALADGIRSVLDSSPEQRARMGRAGRKRVLEHFSWRGTATRTVECYRELIAERRHDRGEKRPAISMPTTATQPTSSPNRSTRVSPIRLSAATATVTRPTVVAMAPRATTVTPPTATPLTETVFAKSRRPIRSLRLVLTIEPERLGLTLGAKVLDVGCGDGRHVRYTRTVPGLVSVALDLGEDEVKKTTTMLREMAELPHESGGAHEDAGPWGVFRGSGYDLPFADGSFDCVIISEVLEHLRDDDCAIDELTRVLRPGGILAVSVPREGPEAVCWALSRQYRNSPGGHVRIYRRAVLRKKLAAHGYKVYGQHFAHGLHSPYWWLKCLVGTDNSEFLPVKLYHNLLVWDLMSRPALTRWMEAALNPFIGKSVVFYAVKA